MKNYETVFILTPVLSEAQMKDTVGKFKSVLVDNGADIVNEENWGLRKLEYPIDHKTTGFYQLFEFRAEPELIAKLETEYRRDEAVMRFLTTALDKHAVTYNERRKKELLRKTKKTRRRWCHDVTKRTNQQRAEKRKILPI